MRLLLDTHVLIWALTEPEKLSVPARTAIDTRDNELLASAASTWEIGTKYRLGKLPQLEATVLNYEAQLAALGAVAIDVTQTHAMLAGTLTWNHGDPFDRMLAAQALLEGVPLVTSDAVFSGRDGLTALGLQIIW